ncbi:MAG: hypothetical protein EA401_00480, partial [Planctomycetota bacterium]
MALPVRETLTTPFYLTHLWAALCLGAALLLSGCGGGSSDSGDDAPSINAPNQDLEIVAGGSLTIDLSATRTPSGAILYTIVDDSDLENASVSLDGAELTISHQGTSLDSGTIIYRASADDDDELSDEGSITVSWTNNAPSISVSEGAPSGRQWRIGDGDGQLTWAFTTEDADGHEVQVEVGDHPNQGSVSIDNGTVTYTPDDTPEPATVSFTLVPRDGFESGAAQSFSFEIIAADRISASPQSGSVVALNAVTVMLTVENPEDIALG